jgi:hypothetical protein
VFGSYSIAQEPFASTELVGAVLESAINEAASAADLISSVIGPKVWNIIDTAQTAGWVEIGNTQNAAWDSITNDAQTDWTLINTVN